MLFDAPTKKNNKKLQPQGAHCMQHLDSVGICGVEQ